MLQCLRDTRRIKPHDSNWLLFSALVEAPGTFDENGWLRVGVVGAQPAVRGSYISTGSLYLCLCGMLHLGLPADVRFWTSPAQAWTQKRLWSGENVPADRKLKNRVTR